MKFKDWEKKQEGQKDEPKREETKGEGGEGRNGGGERGGGPVRAGNRTSLSVGIGADGAIENAHINIGNTDAVAVEDYDGAYISIPTPTFSPSILPLSPFPYHRLLRSSFFSSPLLTPHPHSSLCSHSLCTSPCHSVAPLSISS